MIVTSKYKAKYSRGCLQPQGTQVHTYIHTVGRMAQWIRALATKSNDPRDPQGGRKEPTPEK